MFTSVFAWFFSPINRRGRRIFIWDILSFIFLLPLTVTCTLLGMRTLTEELPPSVSKTFSFLRFQQFSIAMFTVMLDVFVMTWFLVRIQYHFKHWLHWYRRSEIVILLDYEGEPVE
ncbi:Hypothetical protein NTJ_11394 [Nesidiocoris tenuis]|uniref:Uncharacterized protein n=1 Tax=Nesidiocoris tenuis TaxID=355587 RepID=A0ABN7B4Q5_9HEMI|nr:Hypothetical protein NTJ_11394 [Nesidiocoris tenuis]